MPERASPVSKTGGEGHHLSGFLNDKEAWSDPDQVGWLVEGSTLRTLPPREVSAGESLLAAAGEWPLNISR